MNKAQLYQSLNYVNHSREKRLQMANRISANPHIVTDLMQIAFLVDDPVSSKACWVLEFKAKENLAYLFPNLDLFTENIGKVRFDSSVRPMAKICESLIKAYFHRAQNAARIAISDRHLELMTAACFDWLVGDYKVASKAYSMTSLLLLGKKYDWIHPELKMVLEQGYAHGSAAYKARARMTLAKIK